MIAAKHEIKVKPLNELATTPTRGSVEAAGMDLYAAIDHNIAVQPGETIKVGTGIAVALPEGTFGAIFARSGIATKQGLRPANCVGVVDSDYRGEVIVAIHNDSDIEQIIPAKSRIAQLVVMPYIPVNIILTYDLDDTERGDGGFGSTGVK